MVKNTIKKVQTDIDIKRKAVKLVITHLKKKISKDFVGSDLIHEWILSVDALFLKDEFDIKEYIELRKELNDVIERTIDEEMRFKLRDSWYSLGKALDKKLKRK